MYQVKQTSLLSIVLLSCMMSLSTCQDDICVGKSSCTCQFKNGSVIDITSLGNKDGTARFSIGTAEYTYFYNPCYSFSRSGSENCNNVAGCQVSASGDYNLGVQSTASFYLNNSLVTLNYTGSTGSPATIRTLSVELVCADTQEDNLTFNGEVPLTYRFTLSSKCACPDACLTAEEEDGLSTGSILAILFFIFVLCYIFGGIIFQKIMRGATGRELFPNYEFWMDFPLLVRDGVVFTCNGCQNEISYERI